MCRAYFESEIMLVDAFCLWVDWILMLWNEWTPIGRWFSSLKLVWMLISLLLLIGGSYCECDSLTTFIEIYEWRLVNIKLKEYIFWRYIGVGTFIPLELPYRKSLGLWIFVFYVRLQYHLTKNLGLIVG